MLDTALDRPTRPNWGQVAAFLALTFALTWSLDLAIWLTMRLDDPAVGTALQAQMLFPAVAAVILGTFFFRDSRIHLSRPLGRTRLFLWYFVLYSVVYIIGAISVIMSPALFSLVAPVTLVATIIGLLVLLGLRIAGGRAEFARAGLCFGRPKYWLLFSTGVVVFYLAQVALNYAFGLGSVPQIDGLLQQSGMTRETFLIVGGIQTVVLGPIIGLVIAFGEEYGWRGYLQSELIRIGRIRGVMLLGIIWGVWHAPIIAMGHNYPGYPVLGPILMTLVTILLSFVLGYAVLKSGSVLLAAFLHALNNQLYSFLVLAVY